MKAEEIVSAVYEWYEKRDQQAPERTYLGASEIGHSCSRYLWLNFRCAFKAHFDGRMLRLFNTGHRAESRFVDELAGLGWKVRPVDGKGKQFECSYANGHMCGHCDGVASEDGKEWFLLEFKTYNAKRFASLVKTGVRQDSEKYWYQMHFYMGMIDLQRCLFMAENKDNSEVYCEWVDYDADECRKACDKAERIINSKGAPDRITDRPDWYECKFCSAAGVCWGREMPRKNCRTCVCSTPVENGRWSCEMGGVIPEDVEMSGCPEHVFHPYMMPWEPVDSGDGLVLYANGVCNCSASGFPASDDVKAIFNSDELALVKPSQIDEIIKAKQVFGGKVVEG